MPIADLDGPLEDFRDRAKQIRSIVVAIESASKTPTALTTTRAAVDLSSIGPVTGNTANAMSLIFLASTFEEFVREEISQCAGYLAEKYVSMADDARHQIRDKYWAAANEQFRFISTILTKEKPRGPDAVKLGILRAHLDAVKGFVVNDNATFSDPKTFAANTKNLKPAAVNELAKRIGISEFIDSVAESTKIKAYFGVTRKAEAATRLKAKLNEFFDRRNETVHSLSSAAGFSPDVIMDYLDLFDATAESMKHVLSSEIAKW